MVVVKMEERSRRSDTGRWPSSVCLEPFVHQVGGHCGVLKYDENTLCKPLIQREHHFYEQLPEELVQFTPEYRGVVYVTFEEDDEGYVNVTAYPNKIVALEYMNKEGGKSDGSSESDSGTEDKPKRKPHRTSSRSDSKRRSFRVRLNSIDQGHSNASKHSDMGMLDGTFLSERDNKQRLIKLHKKQALKMKSSRASRLQKFILLENVAGHFMHPCILDLKMGTRQHGDDASSDKVKRQIAKCAATTSKSLGVRLCGMQIYQGTTGRFLVKDKYYGRRLTEEGFKESTRLFFHNGHRLRVELLNPLIYRLRKLVKVIEKLMCYRFYSASLLLIYDGLSEAVCEKCQGEVKEGGNGGSVSSEKDSLETLFRPCLHCPTPRVDVRMIDFAHYTCRSFDQDNLHTGPDTGYLFGLQNLVKILEEIRDEQEINNKAG